MIHWLQIGSIKYDLEKESLQWNEIKNYIGKYPNSKTTIFNKNTGDIYAKIIKLECDQNYQYLDLDCNSLSKGSIKHLNSKPNNIELCNKQLDWFVDREERLKFYNLVMKTIFYR